MTEKNRNLLINTLHIMKRKLLVLSAIIFALATRTAQAQLINAGFETWSTDALAPTANDPNSGNGTTGWWDYNFFNSSFVGSSPISVTKCTDTIHTGTYSARIQSVIYTATSHSLNSPWGIPFIGHAYSDTLGILFNGNVNVTSQSYKPGIPCIQKITQFSFYYQYKPNGVDTAECRVELVHLRASVAGGVFKTGKATGASGWQQATITLTYVSALTPDTMYILFSSSSLDVKPKPNSVLWIDDVSVTLPAGINEPLSALAELEVYPNPASNSVNFRINGLKNSATLSIFDITGKIIDNIIVNDDLTSVNTQTYSNGLYFYRLCDNAGIFIRSGKFNVVKF